MKLQSEIEAALLRVFFNKRTDGLAKEQTAAVVAVLKKATPDEIKELLA